jgi:hypothetical protein
VLNLVTEPNEIATERETVKRQLETLRNAQRILKRDPQLAAQSEGVEAEIRRQEEEQKRESERAEKEKADKLARAEKEKADREAAARAKLE